MIRRAILGVLSIVFVWYANEFIKIVDIHKVIYNQQPGPCREVQGVYQPSKGEQGSEDVDVLTNGLAIFSSGLNYMRYPELNFKGRMMSFNFNKPSEGSSELKLVGFDKKLNPHGISTWTEMGKVYVYVIHHAMTEDDSDESVEKFLWDTANGGLTHMRTFKDPTFISLNDLVTTGLDQFYVTNDYFSRNNWLRRLEYFSFLSLHSVSYFDGTTGRLAATKLRRANGIAISPDHRFLYVAEAGAKRITSFKIISPGNLEYVSSTYLGALPDNINVDPETGDLWIGTHPVGYKIILKVMFPVGTVAPSLVLRVKVKEGRMKEISQIYANDGHSLSGSGVASYFKGGILIGTPTHKLLYCDCRIC